MHEIVVTFIERSRAATRRSDLRLHAVRRLQLTGAAARARLDRRHRARWARTTRRPVADREPREDVRLQARGREIESARARSRSPRRSRAARSAGRSSRATSPAHAVLRGGPQGPGGFDAGVERMVTAVLASPDFLYRGSSRARARRRPGPAARIALADAELASPPLLLLLGPGPRRQLLGLAARGKLSQAATSRRAGPTHARGPACGGARRRVRAAAGSTSKISTRSSPTS